MGHRPASTRTAAPSQPVKGRIHSGELISSSHSPVGSALGDSALGGTSPIAAAPPGTDAVVPSWQIFLNQIQTGLQDIDRKKSRVSRPHRLARQPWYVLELSKQTESLPRVQIHLTEIGQQSENWHTTRAATYAELRDIEDYFLGPDERLISEILFVNQEEFDDDDFYDDRWTWKRGSNREKTRRADLAIAEEQPEWMLRDLVRTGRLFWRVDPSVQPEPVRVESFADEPVKPLLVLSDAEPGFIKLGLALQFGQEIRTLNDVAWVWGIGIVLAGNRLAQIEDLPTAWLSHFLANGEQILPQEQRNGLVAQLLLLPNAPELAWPEHWDLRREVGVPTPVVKLKWPTQIPSSVDELRLTAIPTFRYGRLELEQAGSRTQLFDAENSRILVRDDQRECEFLKILYESNVLHLQEGAATYVRYSDVASLNTALSEIGWLLEAQGRPLVAPGQFSFDVQSGVDWLDLSGGVTYANQIVPLPTLLQAMRRKENFVRLDDGSHGMLPTQWIEKFGKFMELANESGDTLRFGRAQALLLDALLADQESNQVVVDAGFRNLRKRLAAFRGIEPSVEPKGFVGKLRKYQREGLGWFEFLKSFGFGGCLADDMGLGKTIQVLALLEQRRSRRLKKNEVRRPTLVVVPKSLIFNWIDEASKFAPKLKVIDFTGLKRREFVDELPTADVILTTYGTLRIEITRLKEFDFDYAILDEAQAIKNPSTDAAKACYLLKADNRLAMTGTPIENHLGDLWSQFRFLNPGLLGQSQAFSAFSRSDCNPESLQQLSKALRPFILRRTKKEVLKELPAKNEQTLFCEMSTKQAKQYNELRDHYRIKLGNTVKELGIKRSKIHVLEALLRLRQAACDGRLVNPKLGARGAKLDLLLEQLEEVTSEGHKVLVFSQFTSMLKLVQTDLKKRKMRFEYLDGQTQDRKSCVARFQTDKRCNLFLISLKAGGHGLNLTAADYVYILDPWWNPATEAQAIDRAHRMGQKKQVFAYRMISKGTVEEKILELQKTKRELAESIISGNNSLIRSLTADDLQQLLS
ncbi:MAG: DEAD/DEAH box helicase [Pirellulaceae bacterium]|nr:DEAD/DEAH box helicase [Pirellulaceae bacterium]